MIATSAGILVTKTTSDDSLSDENPATAVSFAAIHVDRGWNLGPLIALMPGLPKMPFLGVSLALVMIAFRRKPAPPVETAPEGTDPDKPIQPDDERHLDEFLLHTEPSLKSEHGWFRSFRVNESRSLGENHGSSSGVLPARGTGAFHRFE